MSTVQDEDPGILAADRRWAAGLAESLIADSRDALLVLDTEERVVDASPEWLVLCGGHLDQVVGRPFAEVVRAARGAELADLLRRAQNERRPVEAVINHRHHRGFALELAARVIPIGTGGATGGATGDATGRAHLVRLRPPSGPRG
jgi:PAS domain S-box-containing protein